MTNPHDKFIPALGQHWLTPLYDPVQRWLLREMTFKTRLMRQARIQVGQRVLDLGCGTGTLSVLVKRSHPDAEVVGLDVDPQVLAIATGKAAAAGLAITFERGSAFQLSYPDRSVDRVLSSLMLHHLSHEQKERTLGEAHRILKPGGELHVADFGKPHGRFARLGAFVLGHFEQASDNVKGLLPEMMRDAGFVEVEEIAQSRMIVGSISFYRARRA